MAVLLPEEFVDLFVKDTTGDGADANVGDSICAKGSGNCSLRAAIQEANATAVRTPSTAFSNGLWITGGNSTVQGLVINRFPYSRIELETGGGNIVQGNFIGTNAAGTSAQGNISSGEGKLVTETGDRNW